MSVNAKKNIWTEVFFILYSGRIIPPAILWVHGNVFTTAAEDLCKTHDKNEIYKLPFTAVFLVFFFFFSKMIFTK